MILMYYRWIVKGFYVYSRDYSCIVRDGRLIVLKPKLQETYEGVLQLKANRRLRSAATNVNPSYSVYSFRSWWTPGIIMLQPWNYRVQNRNNFLKLQPYRCGRYISKHDMHNEMWPVILPNHTHLLEITSKTVFWIIGKANRIQY